MSMNLILQVLHWNGITWYLSLCLFHWAVSSRLLLVGARVRTSFLFKAEFYIFPVLPVYSSVDGHSVCFHHLATAGKHNFYNSEVWSWPPFTERNIEAERGSSLFTPAETQTPTPRLSAQGPFFSIFPDFLLFPLKDFFFSTKINSDYLPNE